MGCWKNSEGRECDGLGRHLCPRQKSLGVCASEFEDQRPSLHGRDGAASPPMGSHHFRGWWVDVPAGWGARAQGIRGSRLLSTKLPRLHLSRPPLAQPDWRVATEFTRFKSSRLRHLGYFEGEGVFEASSERGIVKTSVEESMERNPIGNSDQGRGWFPEAPAGLHQCQWRPFWINLFVFIGFCYCWS